ncbi:hypothetical protein N0V94_005270 [Neodidymelliopsis sp. IMI 364377]|nr:hypothetical protein N0V94_005270 [Neodidymelliopsis sp. IMI 364377]
MNCFQTGFFGGVLIMDLVAVMRGTSAAGIGFSIFVFLSFVGLLIYSAVGYHRTKKQAQRGNYAAAHNPALLTAYTASSQVPSPYQQNTTAYHPPTDVQAELQGNQYLPPYQAHNASTDYYNQQPLKPTYMV